ncbi:MAG: hypothetical protein ACJAVK_001163 [Akkermansiaceae bacterium]|jgi:hypothetical protein
MRYRKATIFLNLMSFVASVLAHAKRSKGAFKPGYRGRFGDILDHLCFLPPTPWLLHTNVSRW